MNKLDSLTPQDPLCLVDHGQMAPYTNSVHFHQPQYLTLLKFENWEEARVSLSIVEFSETIELFFISQILNMIKTENLVLPI